MEKLNSKEISERIRKLLIQNNMKQVELARITGISKNAITNYMSGERIPDTQNIYLISTALGTTIENLLTGEEKNNLTEDEQNILKLYSQLTEKNKGKAEMFMEIKIEEQQNEIKSSVSLNTDNKNVG